MTLIGTSPGGHTYELVIQSVAKRYEPRDLPERIEVLNIPMQSIVVVQIRSIRLGFMNTFEQKLKVVGAYPDGGETAYFGQLMDAPDGLTLTVRPVGNQPPGLAFRSDHVLRIEQKAPEASDDNVIVMPPVYEIRTPSAPLDTAVGLYYDNKLVGLIEAAHAPALMHILKPPHSEHIHESDSDPHHPE